MNISCKTIDVSPSIQLFHTGPPLDHRPLPSFFYFATSGPDSLTKDPLNQPIQSLSNEEIHLFSMTLPGHEIPGDHKTALSFWSDEFKKGRDPLRNFLDDFEQGVDFLIHEQFVDPEQLSVGGLSRGGLMALHASERKNIKKVLCFAPITKMSKIFEFQGLDLSRYDAPILKGRNLRMYMSNNDTRVGTRECFEYFERMIPSSPKTELIFYPAIGYQGHGTPPEIFRGGADWIKE